MGTPLSTLEADTIEDALAKVEKQFAPKFQEKLTERGVKLEGGILKHSYITLNRKSVKELKDHMLKDGDVLDLFVAVPGG